MRLIICNSNLFVPSTLSILLSHQEEQIAVLVDQIGLIKLFNTLNLKNSILITTQYDKFRQIPSEKKKLLQKINELNVTSIYFYHNEFGEIANWLIYKLHKKKIPIYHYNIYPILPYPKVYNFKSLRIKIKYLLFYSTDMDILKQGKKYIPSLSQNFYRKNQIKNIVPNINNELLNKYISQKFHNTCSKKRILLLTGSVVASKQVEEHIYTQYINNIINTIGADNILAKCHPRFNDLFGNETTLDSIPSYIPANLIINQFDFFIGYNSTLLVEAANINKTAISLIDLIPAVSTNINSDWHTFFNDKLKKNAIIYYPKTIKELNEIIHRNK